MDVDNMKEMAGKFFKVLQRLRLSDGRILHFGDDRWYLC